MTNLLTTVVSTPSCSPGYLPTVTPTKRPSDSPSLTPTNTIPTLEPTFPIYNGLLFNLHKEIDNSSTGYAQTFGSLNSATDFSIGNDSETRVSVQWTGYL